MTALNTYAPATVAMTISLREKLEELDQFFTDKVVGQYQFGDPASMLSIAKLLQQAIFEVTEEVLPIILQESQDSPNSIEVSVVVGDASSTAIQVLTGADVAVVWDIPDQ